MRHWGLLVLCASLVGYSSAQDDPDGPANLKAQKTYNQATHYLDQGWTAIALDRFKKADDQDDGHCQLCQKKIIWYGMELRDWKAAETAAAKMVAEAQGEKSLALAHYQLGVVFKNEGLDTHKSEAFSRAHEEMAKALAAAANFPNAYFVDGQVLAHLKQYDAAKKQFDQVVKMEPETDPHRQCAERYISDPDMARAMAPAFAMTTMDGQRVSLDDLMGRAVLIDFWATWCAPCRSALPQMKAIAKRFRGRPLVILSVSLDRNERKWEEFVAQNEMTWPQYRDGGFKGPIATLFGVNAIPRTFMIDRCGVLQDRHKGGAAPLAMLEELVGEARDKQAVDTPAP